MGFGVDRLKLRLVNDSETGGLCSSIVNGILRTVDML